MERALCEQCGHYQPRDWTPGDLCVLCGAAVRREVRCAWCAEWIPAVKYCRSCGCEVFPPEQYGPARMLKSAGVDRFTLAQRLREMDPEQAANLARIYNAQLAVVARRVEEARLCERYLVQKTFSRRIEDTLVPRLPVEKEPLAELAAGPAGPFDRPELLPEIAQYSPLEITRALAGIALFRMGRFKGMRASLQQAVAGQDFELALEAAFAAAIWRARACPYDLWWSGGAYGNLQGIDRQRVAKVAEAVPFGSPLRPWAAAASVVARHGGLGSLPEDAGPEWLRDALRDGLASRDPDLRFTCAMALGDCEIVAKELDSGDAQLAAVARAFLARRNSPAVAGFLDDGPEELRAEVLEALSEPLPAALVAPVLRSVEQGHTRAVRLLLPSLTKDIVERLVRLGNAGIFKALLECESLPEAASVVRAALKSGLFVEVYGALYDRPEHVDFADPVMAKLASGQNPEVLEKLIGIAERQAERVSDASQAGRFLARVACGGAPVEIRERAWGMLDYRDQRQWDVVALFGGMGGFLRAVVPVLRDPEAGQICFRILERLDARRAELATGSKELVAALADIARGRCARVVQQEAARLLIRIVPVAPGTAIPAVGALLRDREFKPYWDFLSELLAIHDELPRAPALLEELARSLSAMLVGAVDALESRHNDAVVLLQRMARDHVELRAVIEAGMAPLLNDPPWELREAADSLGEALGRARPQPQPEPAETPAPPPLTHLDEVVVFPDAPIKTLAAYAALTRAIGNTADPTAVIASHGLTFDSYLECINQWSEALSQSDEFAMRFSELMTAG